MENSVNVTDENTIELSAVQRAVKIFSDPAPAFESIRIKPTWLFPVIVTIIMAVIMIFLTTDLQLQAQKDAILNSERIPEEQKDALIEGMEGAGAVKTIVLPSGAAIIGSFIYFALAGAVFMLIGNVFMGGQTSYKQNFALAAWGSIIGIAETIVKIPLMISKGSYNVYTSLALLLDESESKTVLFQVFDAIDLFAIWKIVIFAIGFSVIYKFSQKKGYMAIIPLYLIIIAISIGFKQIFSGYF